LLQPLYVDVEVDGKLHRVPHWYDRPEEDWECYEHFPTFLTRVWEHLGLPTPTDAQLEIAHRLQYGYDMQPRYLLPEEEEALLKELHPGRPIVGRSGTSYLLDPSAQQYRKRQNNYDLAVMLLDTGCRFGELANLTWDMVDTNQWKFIRIFRSKVIQTSQAEGMMAVTGRMREILQRRFKERGNNYYVFHGWNTGGRTAADVPMREAVAIRRAIEKVGINHPTKVARFGRRDVRSLRDTFASKLRWHGMSIDRIQKLLGHSTPVMTQKYANLTVDKASSEAVAILDQLNGE